MTDKELLEMLPRQLQCHIESTIIIMAAISGVINTLVQKGICTEDEIEAAMESCEPNAREKMMTTLREEAAKALEEIEK